MLEFLAATKLFVLAELGTSCPDHFLRTKVKPLVLDLPADAPIDECVARLGELHEQYRRDYTAYYERYADDASPPMRGADPSIVLVPGVGMFSYGRDKQTARVAGEFYVNAINVMRGAEAVSTYSPIPESEKFRIEYWSLEEAKLQRMPKPARHAGRIALVTGAASGIGRSIAEQLAAEGACVVIADLDAAKAVEVAGEIGSADRAVGVALDVSDDDSVRSAVAAAIMAFGGLDLVVNNAGLSISAPLLETSEADWDRQHAVMAKGSFLVAKAAARAMVAQGLGGDIVYVVSKNAIFAGPNNVAYGAAKADQAHQVRLLAAELGEYGIRVNGVNPDAVVRGSGIFSGGWVRSVRPSTGYQKRIWDPSTLSARCSSARCCPGTLLLPSQPSSRMSSATPPGSWCPSTQGLPLRSCADRAATDLRGRRPRRFESASHGRRSDA